jgi:hypothetical protein
MPASDGIRWLLNAKKITLIVFEVYILCSYGVEGQLNAFIVSEE